MQVGIAARETSLHPILSDVVSWELDAWLVLHDDLRKQPMIRLVADDLSKVVPTLLSTGNMPIQRDAAPRAG